METGISVKAILEFQLPEEQEEYELANKALDMHSALFDTGQQVFRPHRKHGYSDENIQALLDKLGQDGYDLVSALESKYYDILREYNLDI
jgi:hypothetical protein